MQKAIFLDRDGIITKVLFNGDRLVTCRRVEEVEVLPSVKKALEELKVHGYLLIVVTNQSNIAYGEMSEKDVQAIHHRLTDEFDLPIDAFYYCPHDSDYGCNCKKPLPGMVMEQAMKDFSNIDLNRSFVVGDRNGDMELGRTLGCKTIFIPSPASLWFTKIKPEGDFKAKDLLEAVSIITKS